MELKNKTHITLPTYEKCYAVCDNDCPLGQLYDFSCALQSFVMQKINEATAAKKAPEPSVEENKE